MATFRLKQNMKQHTRIVHGKVKSFECQVGEAIFGTRSNLQNHNKIFIKSLDSLVTKSLDWTKANFGWTYQNCSIIDL